MIYLLISYFIFQVPFKGFCYRARGGAIPLESTQLARIVFWGMPYAIDGAIFAYLLNINIALFSWLAFFCGWLAAVVQHSKWQSPSWYNYVIMGLITTGMLTLILLPFIYIRHSVVMFVPLGMLGALASWIGYKMKYGFNLFEIQWCVPGDSSWEEFFIGIAPFGIAIATIGFYLIGLL